MVARCGPNGLRREKEKKEKARGVASGDATAASAPPLKGAGGIAKAPAFGSTLRAPHSHTENQTPLKTNFHFIFLANARWSPPAHRDRNNDFADPYSPSASNKDPRALPFLGRVSGTQGSQGGVLSWRQEVRCMHD